MQKTDARNLGLRGLGEPFLGVCSGEPAGVVPVAVSLVDSFCLVYGACFAGWGKSAEKDDAPE